MLPCRNKLIASAGVLMQRKSVTRSVVLALAGVLTLAGLLLLAGTLLPYERLKPIADQFARDGSLERFTPALLALFKPGLLIAAACLIAAGWYSSPETGYRCTWTIAARLSPPGFYPRPGRARPPAS